MRVLFNDYCRMISIMALPSLSVTVFQNTRTATNFLCQKSDFSFSMDGFFERASDL